MVVFEENTARYRAYVLHERQVEYEVEFKNLARVMVCK
jgi:hypothetical protein